MLNKSHVSRYAFLFSINSILKIQIRNPIVDVTKTPCSTGYLLDEMRNIIDRDIASLEYPSTGRERPSFKISQKRVVSYLSPSC